MLRIEVAKPLAFAGPPSTHAPSNAMLTFFRTSPGSDRHRCVGQLKIFCGAPQQPALAYSFRTCQHLNSDSMPDFGTPPTPHQVFGAVTFEEGVAMLLVLAAVAVVVVTVVFIVVVVVVVVVVEVVVDVGVVVVVVVVVVIVVVVVVVVVVVAVVAVVVVVVVAMAAVLPTLDPGIASDLDRILGQGDGAKPIFLSSRSNTTAWFNMNDAPRVSGGSPKNEGHHLPGRASYRYPLAGQVYVAPAITKIISANLLMPSVSTRQQFPPSDCAFPHNPAVHRSLIFERSAEAWPEVK